MELNINGILIKIVIFIGSFLTHWGRATYICISKLTIICSDNGLSPGRRQAIIWTNDGLLLNGPLGTNFSEILSKIHTFSFKKMHLKTSSVKWRPFCLDVNVLDSLQNFGHFIHALVFSSHFELFHQAWITDDTSKMFCKNYVMSKLLLTRESIVMTMITNRLSVYFTSQNWKPKWTQWQKISFHVAWFNDKKCLHLQCHRSWSTPGGLAIKPRGTYFNEI